MNKKKGFSLIELLVVIAIIGVIASIAVPSFVSLLQRNRLKSAVQSLQDDLQFARTQAIKKSQSVLISRVQTSSAAGNWCYGLSTSPNACVCTAAASATNCDIKIISGTSYNTVKMISATGNSTFDFRRGTIGANGVTFSTTKYAARVVFSDVGRARICTPPTVSNTVAAANRPVGTIGLPTVVDCT